MITCIESLGLHQRTCDFCVKCDLSYQERFDKAGPKVRQSFVEALAAITKDDLTNPLPILGLITLLNQSEFEDFITRLAKKAPFDNAFAWAIIRLSCHGVGSWFVNRGKAKFQRHFHLHPILAPLLIQSAIRPDHKAEDIIGLFDCYESLAQEQPVMRDALPLWYAELERRRQERIAREENEKAEQSRLDAEQAEWMRKINSITYEGPAAILGAMANASPSDARRFPCNWARITEPALRTLASDLLTQTLSALARQATVRCWRSLAHKVRNALQTQQRATEMASLLLSRSVNGSKRPVIRGGR